MAQDKNYLKQRFARTGAEPTAEDFANLIDAIPDETDSGVVADQAAELLKGDTDFIREVSPKTTNDLSAPSEDTLLTTLGTKNALQLIEDDYNQKIGIVSAQATTSIIGIASTNTAPVDTTNKFVKYSVSDVGIYVNFSDINGAPIEVTQVDIDTGLVEFWGENGVWQKNIVPIPITGLTPNGGYRGTAAELESKKMNIADFVSDSRNLANNSVMVSGTYNDTGSVSASDNWARLPALIVDTTQTKISFSGVDDLGASQIRAVFLNAENVSIGVVYGNGSGTQTATIPPGTIKVCPNICNAIGVGLDPTNSPYAGTMMINYGDPLPFIPYAQKKIKQETIEGINDFAKSGGSSMTVKEIDSKKMNLSDFTITSENLLDNSKMVAGEVQTGGSFNTSTNWIHNEILNTDPSQTEITLSGFDNATAGSIRAVFFNENGEVISEILSNGDVEQTMPLPNGWVKARINVANDVGVGLDPTKSPYANTAMVNYGNTALPYRPYAETKIKQELVEGISDFAKSGGSSMTVKEIDSKKMNLSDFTITSENLLDNSKMVAGEVQTGGSFNTSTNWIHNEILNTDPSQTEITFSGFDNASTGSIRAVFFNENGEVISEILSNGDVEQTMPLPNGWVKARINVANDVGVGLDPTNSPYANTAMVNYGNTAIIWSQFGTLIPEDKILKTSNAGSEQGNSIAVRKISDTQFNIYYRKNADSWFMTKFIHVTSSPERFIDNWRLDSGFTVKRNGDNTFSQIRQNILTGVFETALYSLPKKDEEGNNIPEYTYSNAIGASHGWEVFNSVSLFLDNNIIDLTAPIGTQWEGGEFVAYQNSNFKLSDGSGNIANVLKNWYIKNGILETEVTINWTDSLEFTDKTYMPMCSIMRKDDNGNQVTDRGIPNDDNLVYDISEPGFNTPIYSNQNDPRRTQLTVYGNRFFGRVKVLERWVKKADGTFLPLGFSNAGGYIQNTDLYNKIYFRFGTGGFVEPNEIWYTKTQYDLKGVAA